MNLDYTSLALGVTYIIGILLMLYTGEGLEGLVVNILGFTIIVITLIITISIGYFRYDKIDTKDYLIRETSYGYLIENGNKFIKIEDHHSVMFIKNNPKKFTVYENKEMLGPNFYMASY